MSVRHSREGAGAAHERVEGSKRERQEQSRSAVFERASGGSSRIFSLIESGKLDITTPEGADKARKHIETEVRKLQVLSEIISRWNGEGETELEQSESPILRSVGEKIRGAGTRKIAEVAEETTKQKSYAQTFLNFVGRNIGAVASGGWEGTKKVTKDTAVGSATHLYAAGKKIAKDAFSGSVKGVKAVWGAIRELRQSRRANGSSSTPEMQTETDAEGSDYNASSERSPSDEL